MKVGGSLIGKICDERYNYVLDEFGKNLVLLEIIKQSNKLEMLSWTHQVKTLSGILQNYPLTFSFPFSQYLMYLVIFF